jgi:uncharacterized membrane protein YesL
MENIFGYDNKFFELLGKITDIVILNVLFIISSLPIVTIGASLCATYTVAMQMVKDEETYIVKEFIKRFKSNFKQSTIIWLITMCIIGVLAIDFHLSDMIANSFIKNIFQYVFTIVGIMIMFVITYIFPIISKFDNTIKNSIRNSLLISIKYLPYTIIMVLMNLSFIILIFSLKNYWGYIIFFYITIGFGLVAYINSILLNKIFNRYIN